MAKTNRQLISLECSVCKNRNYTTSKNTIQSKEKLSFNKFCKKCRKVNLHNEGKIK